LGLPSVCWAAEINDPILILDKISLIILVLNLYTYLIVLNFKMHQEIRFCTAVDGTRSAYVKVGQGLPLLKVGNWMSYFEYDWNSPVWKPWLEN
jgi:hypothetical protein